MKIYVPKKTMLTTTMDSKIMQKVKDPLHTYQQYFEVFFKGMAGYVLAHGDKVQACLLLGKHACVFFRAIILIAPQRGAIQFFD